MELKFVDSPAAKPRKEWHFKEYSFTVFQKRKSTQMLTSGSADIHKYII